jgi:lipopolysaccharide/colanic/teichoic acid biosynthesis glycosyltransferase
MVMATYSGAGTDASLSARRTRRAARGLLLALVVLTGVWVLARAIVTPRPVVRPANAWQAAVQTLDPRTPIEDVLKNRHLMWRTALRLFGEEPLLGVGLGTFPRLYGRDTPGQRPENAHNFFLQTLAEAGLAGLLALTLLAGSVVLAMRPYVRGTRRRARRLALGLAVGLLAWLLTSITGHPALTVSNQIWLGSALAVGLAALRPPPTTAGPAAVGLRWSVSRPASQSLKRTIDVVVSAALLTVLLPLLALVALLIRLDSPGPALFRHRRVTTRAGSSDRSWRRRDAETCIFELIKFRTMWRDADPYARSPTTPDDPRITRVGRILRRTCLDELPQLWNVLRGDVSLVGPRPEMLGIVEAYDPSARQRLCVQPGLTGLWQLRGRRDRAIHEDLRWDLTYVRRRSLWLDLAILCETAWFALRRRNL